MHLMTIPFPSNTISLHTMFSPFQDYPLFPVRYPPSRPSSCLVFLKLSLPPSSTCNCTFTLTPAETTKLEIQRRHDAFEQFLIEKCGFSQSQLTALVNKGPFLFKSKSTHTAEQAVELFIDSGFTLHQVRKTILGAPNVLTLKVEGHIKEKIHFFKTTVGLDQDVGHVVAKQPRILTYSLEGNLGPKVPLLVNLFGSPAKASKAIKRTPSLLVYGFEALGKRLKVLERNGLKEHQIEELLEKDPHFLICSTDKIEKNMVFLTRTAGFRPSIVVKYPKFLHYSIEKRLNPRFKVFQYLTAVLPAKDVTMSFPTMLVLTEPAFAVKVLMGRPSLAKLYEEYMGRSVDLEITSRTVNSAS